MKHEYVPVAEFPQLKCKNCDYIVNYHPLWIGLSEEEMLATLHKKTCEEVKTGREEAMKALMEHVNKKKGT